MRKLYYYMAAALLLFAAGCQHEEIESVEQSKDVLEVYASIEDIDDGETRTYLSGSEVYWSSGDQIAVFYKNTLRKRFDVTPESIDSKDATFLLDEGYVQMGSNVKVSHNVAYYPFCEVTCAPDGSSYTLSNLTLPSTQSYVEGSVGLGAFPMVAVTENTDDVNFCFKNICGVMQFQLKGSGFVKSVSVRGNRGEVLAGSAVVTAGYGTDPSISMSTEGVKEVTLDCGESGVELNETTPVSFFIVLPPVGFEGGFTITVTDTWGGSKEYSTTKKNPVGRSKGLRMPAKEYVGEKPDEIKDPQDLATQEPANCYIVSQSGSYSFPSVKGNGNESVGSVASAEVLWETFGTDQTPNKGDLIAAVKYENGQILFATPATFQKGNAVIAAKDASGTILWSWHIWFTDEPEEQVYYNNAGTMMDRNLGATSATPGDVGALGLLYQWGRKDPFLGSSSISSDIEAKSTGTWPSAVSTSSSTGTVDYVASHPTTFVYGVSSSDNDWHYALRDNTLWTTSDKAKSIYDPCPAGWRVPDGGSNGVWSKAGFADKTYDSTNEGMSFSISSPSTTWYPTSGYRRPSAGSLLHVGYFGNYWSASPGSRYAYRMGFDSEGDVDPSNISNRAIGLAVRCVKEGSQSSGDQPLASSASDLGTDGTANSYIVSKSGTYKFKPVKGNSSTSVGSVSSVEVLWESFGTDVTPNVGDLIKTVNYDAGYVVFATPSSFTRGNAVIAAKDASGTILWSWHIWLTDQPEEHVYYNNAGTMMDRNLGATSATPGDVGALGLLYQWGRKDPFLGSSSISENIEAKSTGTWPSAVSSDSSNGTIAYATANPTTFIGYNSDWYYTGSSTTDNTRWTTSATTKSIYDPCPAGWRVPDGGSNGIWSKALGLSSYYFTQSSLYDSINEGVNFSGKFGSDQTIWYPASGYRSNVDGGLSVVGGNGLYWCASPNSRYVFHLYFDYDGYVYPWSDGTNRAYGHSVRCIKEGTGGGSSDSGNSSISTSSAVSLTTTGTSNSYIVSQKGTYSFPTVKGNSSASVGSVESAEVLWESFGTDVTPEDGDLVSAALYRDGNIYFKTADTFKEGNAVIAAKDASGKILWSWHIWLTDQPKEQVYYNNAGTMMDRNLGATSATPGDVGTLGLLYQWGRKDPFLGSSSISSNIEAKSTGTWPSSVESDSGTGTIAYAIANPTTFITRNSENEDWYYTGSSTTDNTRWTTSATTKSIYDPCPSGWRVPDGGSNGVWSKALGSSSDFTQSSLYDSTNEGINFSGKFGSASTIWYPASGSRYSGYGGGLSTVGYYGDYWSASPSSSNGAYYLYFYNAGRVGPSHGFNRASGKSVRCLQE